MQAQSSLFPAEISMRDPRRLVTLGRILKIIPALLLYAMSLVTLRSQETREWHFQTATGKKPIRANLWSYHEGNGVVSLKLTSPAEGYEAGRGYLIPLKDLSEEDQSFVKAANVSTLPAKAGIPADPDIMGIKLRMSADEVSSLLKEQGFGKVEVQTTESLATKIVRRVSPSRTQPPGQVGRVVSYMRAFKNDAGKTLNMNLRFVEDISVSPPIAKCCEISLTKIGGPDSALRQKWNEAAMEKYGTPIDNSNGAYYADNLEARDDPDENAPAFRFIKFSFTDGILKLKDVGYLRRQLGLQNRRIEEAANSSKVELPKPKF